MKVLVTVGTTPFEDLIKFLDMHSFENIEYIFQISNGDYKPKNFEYFEFTKNIDKFYKDSDFIICHAGAGTIYKLLDLNKKMIVVPNSNRVDPHQFEIARFINRNNYGLFAEVGEDLIKCIKKIQEQKFQMYKPCRFFKLNEITSYINNL